MKQLLPDFAEHISGQTTTLCRCWIIETSAGKRLGFTDHDADILIEGVLCERDAGMESSAVEERTGFNVNSFETSGALQSERITEADVTTGVYDGAKVSTYLVNWREPSQFVLDRVMLVGEIIREDGLYRMELRGLSSILDQTQGKHFVSRCQANLGDERCRVNLDTTAHKANGTISNIVSNEVLVVSNLGNYEAGWFRAGQLIWTSGKNQSAAVEILDHTKVSSGDRLVLWQPMPHPVSEGDSFTVTAGCNRDFETCKAKFSNAINFQGFPHMPGNRFALGNAANNDTFDGGPIVK